MNQYAPFYFNLREVFSNRVFLVPVYQRPYAWENLQAETIIEDLKKSYTNKEELFIGTIYLKKLNQVSKTIFRYEIIDGQQRLTTFSLIMMCVYVLSSKAGIAKHLKEFIDVKEILWKFIDKDQYITLIESGSVERQLLIDLFGIAFYNPEKYESFISEFASDNTIEINLINALKKIYYNLHAFFYNSTSFNGVKLQEFTEYFLTQVTVIFIETNTSRRNVFEMFEAINSKGKQLEEIDLIKLFIFSQLEEKDYDVYLEKWGKLLLRTNNELADYIWIYIKAYLKFFQNSPNARHFKNLINELTTKKLYFNSSQVSFVLKKMIDKLIEYVDYFRCLDNINDFKKITSDDKTILQMNIYQMLRYEHIRPIIFRALIEFEREKINVGLTLSTEKLYNLLKSLNSFMIQFQSLSKMESKYTIPIIKTILINHYKSNTLNYDDIQDLLNSRLLSQGIDEHWFEKFIKNVESYREKITDLGYIFHSIFESSASIDGGLDYAKANFLLENKKRIIAELIMPKEVNKQDKFYYYKIIQDKEEILKLKKDSDFPNTIQDGMPYDIFFTQILTKIGNIRLRYKITANNTQIFQYRLNLPEFCTYKELESRSSTIAATVIHSGLFDLPTLTNTYKGNVTTTKSVNKLDFEELSVLTFSKPKLVVIFGDEFIPSNNRDVAKIVFDYLYDLDDTKFLNMLDGKNNCGTPSNPYFSKRDSDFISSKQIANSPYYFNAQKSAIDLMIMILHVFTNIYGYDVENLEIYYEKVNT